MNRFIPVTALAIAVAFVAPAAVASWSSNGNYEPDTIYDIGSGFIWEEAPGTSTSRIYFNAYQTTAVLGSGAANPNVAALRSQFTAPGNLYFEAHLGVWTDCNKDGYIGMAETAAREYRSELLVDTSICPPITGPSMPAPGSTWQKGVHNYNGWVTELIPILRFPGSDARTYKDPGAMVWGDFGIPVPEGDEFSAPAAGANCPITPLPRGFWQQTGGAIDYVDCFAGHTLGETYNAVILGGRVTVQGATVDTPGVDESNSLGLALDDSDTWIQPGHPLNRPTFGSEKASDGAVKAQDCGATPIYSNENLRLWVRPVPANPVEPSGSVAGSFNHTTESMRENCQQSTNDNGDFYATLGEGDQAENSASRKVRAAMNFESGYGARGGLGVGLLSGRAGGPADGGVDALGGGMEQAEWRGGVTYVGNTPGLTEGRATRGTLMGTIDESEETDSLGVGDIRPANASYATFYAYVPNATAMGFEVPSSTNGVYAAAFCPTGFGAGAGVHWGWECDASQWYILENGQAEEESEFTFARPGQAFQFRDVDCWDGTFSLDSEDQITYGIEPAAYGSPC